MKNKRLTNKKISLLISIVLLATVTVGGTLAYLVTNAGPVVNKFTPSKVACDVEETFNSRVKEYVKIKNTGNTDAYIRADVIITWQNRAGDVLPQKPVENTDYIITYGNWTASDGGYYYYNEVVAPEGRTSDLIVRCEQKKDAPVEGYFLCVEIVAEAIQAKGETSGGKSVIEDVWGNQ